MPRATTLATVAMLVGSLVGSRGVARPLDTHPMPTRSWYVRSTDPVIFAREGCATAQIMRDAKPAQRSAVILIFGGFASTSDGAWGFDLYHAVATPASPSAVNGAVRAYIEGYERCAHGAGQHPLTLVIGTTTSSGQVTRAAAVAFARVVDAIGATLPGQQTTVTLLAGNDIELGYIGPVSARAWVDGYHDTTERLLVNYGDLAGCPFNRMPKRGDCGSPQYPEWDPEDVWHVTGHPRTLNFPGIYVTTGVQARQWQYMSRYGRARHGRPLKFLGALSQIAACQVRPCSRWTRNTAPTAWRQLRNALATEPAPAASDLTVSDMAWMPTDQPAPTSGPTRTPR